MRERKEPVVSLRLKREECKRTKHDTVFSEWKVLIGASDWEEHSLGKEGVERYRVHNLPNCSSCSGLYELGVVASCSGSRRESSKVDPNRVIPVYLGQADNVRTRLQHYGRGGSHLKNAKSTGQLNDSVREAPGLFSGVFSRGYSIVYRWAPMKNKRDAEKTEFQLLDTFDYAWNRGSNGIRRPNDILQKIDKIKFSNSSFSAIAQNLRTFNQKKVGIKIEACKPLIFGDGPNTHFNLEKDDLFSRILKIGRSRPRLVSKMSDFKDDQASICGVALGQGYVCRKLPIGGRKRCAEHKGMKVNGFTSKLIEKEESHTNYVEAGFTINPVCDSYWDSIFSYDMVKPQQIADDSLPVRKESLSICGVALGDGTLCSRQPAKGRKRCEEHKGRKAIGSLPKSDIVQCPVFPERSITIKMDAICGVNLRDGSFCTREPVVGRKRCEEHKGMKITLTSC